MLKIARYLFINTLLGIIFYFYLYYSQFGTSPKFIENVWQITTVLFAFNIIGFCLNQFNKLLNRIFAWRKKILLRFIIGILINYIFVVILIYSLLSFYFLLFKNEINISDFFLTYFEINIRVLILSFFTIFIFVITDFSIYSYNQYAVVQIENIKQITEQIELQYEALKTQLSPHYLFNSLNTISSLIYKSANLTEEFIRKLAKTYQYILESDSKKLIKISSELKMIEAYKFLLEVRFGNNININCKIEDDILNSKLPPLSIQILVENAVKHSVFDDENKLNIEIYNKRQYIIVKNNKLKKPENISSFNIGIENIKSRLAYFTSKKINISDTDDSFMVSIPLISKLKTIEIDFRNKEEIIDNTQL